MPISLDYLLFLDTMLYVELNPVRAKLVETLEQWEHGSSFCRSQGIDGWLMPLDKALPGSNCEQRSAARDRILAEAQS